MTEIVPLHSTGADRLASQLRRQIVTGELTVGERLPPEPELRERFGASRATLRAALVVLESEGLIKVHRGARGGIEVTQPDIGTAARYFGLILQSRSASVADYQAARVALEPPLARMVAERAANGAGVDVVAALEAAIEAEKADGVLGARAALTFHAEVAALSGSTSLALAMDLLTGATSHLYEAQLAAEPRRNGRAHRAHEELLEKVRAGDADGAEEVWRAHVEEIETRLLKGGKARTAPLFE
ncbi:FadR/GntR family transcriptional regulator [Sporichthya polymorpha]|uniref:FadR/GntR family transcriptional regulator n=1 Tax=Sporichthya polymorpha TaxID=35751 RepID=UPI0003704A7D|nr:GntR family transcriptional regulator [Sporichthya polymorpha]